LVTARLEVWFVDLAPTVGREIREVRPCIIVSPHELNQTLGALLVAPMTPPSGHFPPALLFSFKGNPGKSRWISYGSADTKRLVKRLGKISPPAGNQVLVTLREMFEE
jgi:mRNA interferase MazF